MEQAIQIHDYIDIVKRRKWSLILPALLVIIAAGATALLLPPTYKSTSTILIEEQEIPKDYIMSTVTSFAEQRLQVINQRIMSTSHLVGIIDRFNLYADLRKDWTMEEIIGKLRNDVHLDFINANVMDPRTGRPSTATIAFTLSYEGKNPGMVQKVSSELASLYLKENLKVREKQVKEASAFFNDEISNVREEIGKLESKVAAFKESHVNSLPELLQSNRLSLDDVERALDRLREQVRTLQERKSYFEVQLAVTPANLRDAEAAGQRELEKLQQELTGLGARFSDKYPDVVKLKTEIAVLKVKLQEKPTAVAETIKQPNNPAHTTLASQLAAVESDLLSSTRQLKDLERNALELRQRIHATPQVEKEFGTILADRNNLQAKYSDLMAKFLESKVAQSLEKDQKGERFTLIDPARLPEKPYKPNRLAIFLIGLMLGLGAGVGTAAIREMSDNTVHNPDVFMRAGSFKVLACIPEIVSVHDRNRIRRRRLLVGVTVVICLIAGAVIFNYTVMDFDILFAKLNRKFL